jgi:hypothetical protein
MERSSERVFRGYLTPAEAVRAYAIKVARIARGELSAAERCRLEDYAARLDPQGRGGHFNGLEYFHFRHARQGSRMAAFLIEERLHRLVAGSSHAASPEEVEAELRRLDEQRRTILAWARANKVLMEIVQTYRFERRQGTPSLAAHAAAATVVQQIDRSVADPMAHAGVCIEWAEREYHRWFWRCAPDHQVL